MKPTKAPVATPVENPIPIEAIKASEKLRNPQHISRTKNPVEIQRSVGPQDPFSQERVSPDQPSFREATTSAPDTKVSGG